jgi:23S rRNA (cytidine1920-2'-O)/16S rRNA (cytidine1409-2'-O)-methyltransferase
MGKRKRLDKLLVERGLTASRDEGRRRILAGEVLVNDLPAGKPGSLVESSAVIQLRGKPAPYVSRGGSKLEHALNHFQIDVAGKVALDVGASTGGFTDCLLCRGARFVFAVDVGYGQLSWKLRNDPRVAVLERSNIRYLEPDSLPAAPEIATIDVSFISLRLVFPRVMKLLVEDGSMVALIKPQFEVGKGKVGHGGVVRRPEEHLRVIEEIEQAAQDLGLRVCGVTESPLLGPKGNREFFIHLRKRP